MWQPIETAPLTEGFAALLFVPGLNDWQRPRQLPRIVVGAWVENYGHGYWVSDYAEMDGGYESTGDYITHPPMSPTHWAPLPELPDLQKSTEST